jgi:hypothetical protein
VVGLLTSCGISEFSRIKFRVPVTTNSNVKEWPATPLPVSRGGFRIFQLTHYLWEIQNSTIILPTFPSKTVPMYNYTFAQSTVKLCKTFLEDNLESIISSSIALITSVASQKGNPFNADCSLGNRQQPAVVRSGKYKRCSNVVILFFAKKTLAKTDRGAAALSWRWKQLMVLHY